MVHSKNFNMQTTPGTVVTATAPALRKAMAPQGDGDSTGMWGTRTPAK